MKMLNKDAVKLYASAYLMSRTSPQVDQLTADVAASHEELEDSKSLNDERYAIIVELRIHQKTLTHISPCARASSWKPLVGTAFARSPQQRCPCQTKSLSAHHTDITALNTST